jgi:hypothetical protein
MLQKAKALWTELKQYPEGHRFEEFYANHRQQRTRGRSLAFSLAAVLCFAIGVVLVFVPGPAFLFFGIALALIATQSLWVAQRLDALERALRHFRRQHAHHH